MISIEMATEVVDPDGDPASWPKRLRTAALAFTGDMFNADDELGPLLEGRGLRAYHATRLLPHEVSRIHQIGLLRLTRQHVFDRLNQAVAVGAIADETRNALLHRQVFAPTSPVHDQVEGREGQVCLVVGRSGVNPEGLSRLLTTWGGEAIYWAAGSTGETLRSIGTPTVVAVDLIFDSSVEYLTAGPVMGVFAARMRGLPADDAEVHWFGDVPASRIAAIWQPGSPEYLAFSGLPQT